MKCEGCRRDLAADVARCPHCGTPVPDASGVYRTSTVLISKGGGGRVYRSVEEAPEDLRAQLRKSLNSVNSATILIADRRGRLEIAKALRNLPAFGRRRRQTGEDSPRWLTPRRRAVISGLMFALALALVAVVFLVHWR
jgi:hypothetical protein